MGQYYNIITAEKDYGNIGIIDDKRTKMFETGNYFEETFGAKITEHSWFGNHLTSGISNLLYKTPKRIIWCGDYAEDDELKNLIPGISMSDVFSDSNKYKRYLWDNIELFDHRNKWLVNYSKREQVSFNDYMNESNYGDVWYDKTPMIMYPVSLLTALGNGRGGGDYHEGGTCFDKVGTWAGDMIGIEDEKQSTCKVLDLYFVETYGQKVFEEKFKYNRYELKQKKAA